MAESKILFFCVVALAAFAIGFFAYSSPQDAPAFATAPTPAVSAPPATITPSASLIPTLMPSEQAVSVRALSTGYYDKQEVTVKAGVPVKFEFSADPGAGCGRALYIPDFDVQLRSLSGETVSATFTPTVPGDYPYRCGMNMFRGVLHVK
jgi:heme/copper-type cytochrome/quinol oxidase subunit 2